jgi:hypothetical protein
MRLLMMYFLSCHPERSEGSHPLAASRVYQDEIPRRQTAAPRNDIARLPTCYE